MRIILSSVAAAAPEKQARLASFVARAPTHDVPADFAPFVGSGPSATIEALRALAARPRAALPGLAKDGPATGSAKNRTDARRPGSFGFTNSRSDPIVRS
jgi:hypothetical protein